MLPCQQNAERLPKMIGTFYHPCSQWLICQSPTMPFVRFFWGFSIGTFGCIKPCHTDLRFYYHLGRQVVPSRPLHRGQCMPVSPPEWAAGDIHLTSPFSTSKQMCVARFNSQRSSSFEVSVCSTLSTASTSVI